MRLRTLFAAALVLLALFGASSCSSGEAKVSDEDQAPEEWLFSLQASGTTSFDPQTGMLRMPVNSVLAFTDRPNRLSASESPESFAQLWSEQDPDSFAADPPNIVITWWASGGGYSDSMEVAKIGGEVSYDANSRSMAMKLTTDGAAALILPTSMDHVALFVDGLSANCPGGSGGSATVSGNGKSSPVCVTTKTF